MATAAAIANKERFLADKAQGLPVCSLNIAESFKQLTQQESASTRKPIHMWDESPTPRLTEDSSPYRELCPLHVGGELGRSPHHYAADDAAG